MRDDISTVRFGALALRPDGGGVSTYARELMDAIVPMLSSVRLSAQVQEDVASDLPASISRVKTPVAAGVRRALRGFAPAPGVGLFHGLDVDLPCAGPIATVSTVHDMSVVDVPWAFSRFRVTGERLLVKRALSRADRIIAVSDFTAQRIADLSGRHAEVIHLAPAPWATPPSYRTVEETRRRLRLPERFVLQVGTIEPRKDTALVQAVAAAVGLPCVLAGAGTVGAAAPSGVLGLGYVKTADLPALYSAATVVAYASRYEGFGLPPVEAMACGGAVVASRVGALPDVVGDGAELPVKHTVDDWLRAVRPLALDQQANNELRRRALIVANGLSWTRTAAATVQVYRDLGLRL